jgi:hypothetical protein
MNLLDVQWPTEPDWHLGVTGSRKRYDENDRRWYPTASSVTALRYFLEAAVDHGAKYLHHGCCTGWDECAVHIVGRRNLDFLVYAHPPTNLTHFSQSAHAGSHVVYKPKIYRERDFDIAEQSAVLVAGPAWPEFDERSKRSGTWMTVRFGRRLSDLLYAIDMQGDLTDVTRDVVAGTDSTEVIE